MPGWMNFFLQAAAAARPRVGVSACLAGQRVRYDGEDKGMPGLIAALALHCEPVPLCPELAAGFGVPRPPVQLHWQQGQLRALGRDDPALDATGALQAAAREHLAAGADFCGYLLKSKSPSCGLGSTPLYGEAGATGALADGLFAAALRPLGVPLADELALADAAALERFAQGCRRAWEVRHCAPEQLPALLRHYGLPPGLAGEGRAAVSAALLRRLGLAAG